MGTDISEKKLTYESAGKEISLTPTMVRNYLTKGNAKISTQEAINFMKLCQYQQLNPFLNEAYLIKYSNNKPADMIVSKEAYMKKAESHPLYEGFTAGLILLRNDKMIEVEGSFKMPDDKLLGGWCIVKRKDRKDPTISKVVFKEYSTYKATWKKKPCTMIRKVAIVQAHREAFPNLLGGMYTPSESGVDDEEEGIPNIDEANQGDEISFDDEEEDKYQKEAEDIEYSDLPEEKMQDDEPEGLTEEEKQEILENERKETEEFEPKDPDF